MPEKLLRLPAVAEILDTTYENVLALGRAGLLPVVRVGRRGFRVDPEKLRDWIEAGGADAWKRKQEAATGRGADN